MHPPHTSPSAALKTADSAQHLRDLGGRYLLRLADTGARRILCAFRMLAPQNPGCASRDLTLERLYASLDTDGRRTTRETLFRLGIFPGAADADIGGRNWRRIGADGSDPYGWGISPFNA